MTTPRTDLDPAAVRTLRRSVTGEVIVPGDSEYELARRVWNGMIDRFPAVVVRPRSTPDVAAAISAAQRLGLEIAVRGGGHNIAGAGTVDGGLVIDQSLMRGVTVDPVRRRSVAQGGALLRDLDAATAAAGLATPGGMVSHTGVAGLTLHGGYGYLSRSHGLACDNLVGAELVTADGSVISVSETENADLLWGLRGAGANFGVLTSLEFRLHPLPAVVETGDLFYALDDAPAVIRAALDLAAEAPDALNLAVGTRHGRSDHNLPDEHLGVPLAMIYWAFVGEREAAERLVAPILAAARPLMNVPGTYAYAALQQASDTNMRHDQRVYWKSSYLPDLSDAGIEAFLGRGRDDADSTASAEMLLMGGAQARVGEDDTAFSHRGARWDYLALGAWPDAADDERRIADIRRAWDALQPYAMSAAYVNNMGDEGADRVRAAYGDAKYRRLQALKDRFDPGNVFHRNQNVRPSAATAAP